MKGFKKLLILIIRTEQFFLFYEITKAPLRKSSFNNLIKGRKKIYTYYLREALPDHIPVKMKINFTIAEIIPVKV